MPITVTVPDHLRESLIALGLAIETVPDPGPALPVAYNATPPSTPEFVPPSWWTRFNYAMARKRGACLFGPRGSGKTTAVHEYAKASGIKLVTYQAAAGCTIDDLVGVRDLIDGRTVFTPGPLPEALKDDCALLIEEANVMHPAVFSKFNTLTDGSGDKCRLPDGSGLPAGPGFRVVLAFNEGACYSGTREVNAALRDRLLPIYCGYFPAAQEEQIVRARTGCDSATATALVGYAAGVRAARANLGFDLSPRALFDTLDMIRDLGLTWEQAHKYAVLDRLGDPHDRKPQRDAVTEIAKLSGLFERPIPVFAPVA